MQIFWLILYNIFFIPLLRTSIWVTSFFDRKVREGLNGRKNQLYRIRKAISTIDNNKKRLYFHATSVGEWEQAVPVIEELKRTNPDFYIIVTFFSPSGYKFMKQHPDVDLKLYMAPDSYWSARKFFLLIQPDLWIISKFDIWPTHLYVAGKMNIPVVLIDGTLSANSRRNRGIAKIINKTFYQYIDFIYPISNDDKNRFSAIFPYPEKMMVTGDTRFDQVYNKCEKANRDANIHIFTQNDGIIFIAGSIWPSDEKHLMPAIISMYKKYKNVKFLLVPHELHESHLADLEKTLHESSIPSERYTVLQKEDRLSDKRIVILDTIGLLAKLYKQTQIAYIGGSFGSGVHNVMEAAVFSQPVLFGPHHVNSFEALELLKNECAFAVSDRLSIESILEKLLTDSTFLRETGHKARDLMMQNLGATKRITDHLRKRYDFIS